MATSNNAPMPTGATGPAETFDSTIGASTGPLSQIGLPGPDPSEAPIHAGMVNGIDPYFNAQYIAMQQFTWTTSMDPATLLWHMPVHPTRSHQWMQHLSKMYNTFGGGFDFAFKIAGTGFHAGALIFARIPPNIKPSTLLTLADITAFEYTIIDPKTLEVEMKSVMDQRNIMYHWMKFDESDPQTFGGYIACYCMMPLNTSSTGATSIQIQVWTKPTANFMFSQIKPLQSGPSPSEDYKEVLEAALNFSSVRAPTWCNGGADRYLKAEVGSTSTSTTINVVKGDGQPYNGTSTGINFDDTMNIYTSTNLGSQLQIDDFMVNSSVKKLVGADGYCGIGPVSDLKIQFYVTWGGGATFGYGLVGPGELVLAFKANSNARFHMTGSWEYISPGRFEFTPTKRYLDGTVDMFKMFKSTEGVPDWDDKVAFQTGYKKWLTGIEIKVYSNGSISSDHFYAPPISETILSPNDSSMGRQFASITQVFASKILIDWLKPGDAILFELWDVLADLPVSKMKLYFEGFMTVPLVKSAISFDFFNGRYNFKFLNKIKGNTPFYSGKKDLKYVRNAAIASLF